MAKRFPHVLAAPLPEARIWTLKMAPEEIGYVNCIFEAYEGLGIFRTADQRRGLVEVWVMPGFEDDFQAVLAGLRREVVMEIVKAGGACAAEEQERAVDGALGS
ncbi:MAG: DUF4911 domain-containing protein [Candidatus Sumerlaeota bacterium]|nr:DUF4911 domain-containing protein [Candidatus Sumerlaeota bacterium]